MKPTFDKATTIICKPSNEFKLDPIGYFLIRIVHPYVEIGFCKKNNEILKIWKGLLPQDIYNQIIKDLPKLRREHCAYLGKEITRAYICMRLKQNYTQDGDKDGRFPEIIEYWRRVI